MYTYSIMCSLCLDSITTGISELVTQLNTTMQSFGFSEKITLRSNCFKLGTLETSEILTNSEKDIISLKIEEMLSERLPELELSTVEIVLNER